MGANPLGSAAEFLIRTLFDLYILIIMLRFLLQVVRADFYNPLSQLVVRASNPVLVPLRRLIPGLGGVDISSVMLMLTLKMAELALIVMVVRGLEPSVVQLLIISFADLTQLAVYVFIFAVIIQVVLSWIAPGTFNPVVSLVFSLTEPLLGRARKLIPPFSGLDLSPLIVLVGLQLILILVVGPLYALA
jgi:YggT family protein